MYKHWSGQRSLFPGKLHKFRAWVGGRVRLKKQEVIVHRLTLQLFVQQRDAWTFCTCAVWSIHNPSCRDSGLMWTQCNAFKASASLSHPLDIICIHINAAVAEPHLSFTLPRVTTVHFINSNSLWLFRHLN